MHTINSERVIFSGVALRAQRLGIGTSVFLLLLTRRCDGDDCRSLFALITTIQKKKIYKLKNKRHTWEYNFCNLFFYISVTIKR